MSVAHPDMSMPFNVVSFTSTGLVLYLGVVTRSIVRGAEPYHSARRGGQKKLASIGEKCQTNHKLYAGFRRFCTRRHIFLQGMKMERDKTISF